MAAERDAKQRFFKTAWFDKAARKAHISDSELCSAIAQVLLGQADDLGGGVYKKRLKKNLYRSIIITRADRYWIYTYLFAKQDKANIKRDELLGFRDISASYTRMSDRMIEDEIELKELTEICHGGQQI